MQSPKRLSLLFLGTLAVTTALVSCTASDGGPGAIEDTSNPAESAAANLTDVEKAAVTVVDYAKSIKEQDASGMCDALDPRVAEATMKTLNSQGGEQTTDCQSTFARVLSSTENPDALVMDNVKYEDIAPTGKEVSPGIYSFPEDVISEGSPVQIFVKKIGDEWKITFDPAEEEAIKQLETP